MKKLLSAFGGLRLTWPVICGLAVIVGVYYVGVSNQVPILYDTSFQDIAVTLEWWVLFAVLIVSNCQCVWEAASKCLIFFLISQPVIYLVELPTLGWEKAQYYLSIWLPISLLTFPGGAIAYFAKKQNLLGAVILSIGNTIVALMGVSYFLQLASTFPRHLLTVLSCATIVAGTILGVQKNWQTRLWSFSATVLLTVGVLIWATFNGRVI